MLEVNQDLFLILVKVYNKKIIKIKNINKNLPSKQTMNLNKLKKILENN